MTNTPMKSVEAQIAEMEQVVVSAMTCHGEYQVDDAGEHATEIVKAILSIERNGIPLKRVVGLWEQGKLVQLDEDQRWPDNPHDFTDRQRRLHFYECHDRCHAAEQEAAEEAGFKRVTEIRGE